MPRGRPVGSKKRDAAYAAAWSVIHRQCDTPRSAALASFHLHAGGAPRDRIVEGNNEFDRFNDFVAYVEEAYRELILDPKNHRGSLRATFGPLNERSANRRRQPSERRKFMAAFKTEATAMSAMTFIRDMLGLRKPN